MPSLGFYFNDYKVLNMSDDPPVYSKKCKRLLEEPEIRFAGILDELGNLVSGGFKDGITPLEQDDTRLKSFMEFVSGVSLPKVYDDSLGAINYLAARRDNVILMSFPFPVSKILLLISAEPSSDIEKMATKIVDLFTRS